MIRRMAGWVLSAVLVGALAVSAGLAQSASRAGELIRNHQYDDAVKVLLKDIEGRPDAEVVKQHLMLGECCYLTRQYDKAKGWYERAEKNATQDADKIIARYRLACTAFRLKQFDEANQKITDFITQHPDDAHVGKLLAYRMLILAPKGKAVEKDMEALHARIYSDIRKYDHATGVEADEILCDFYRQTGQPEKAETAYSRIVSNFRQVIAEHERNKQPIPAAFEKAHDNAALQLGIICLDKKQPAQAVQWLENVRYDLELKGKARLFLAKIAYEKQDYRQAQAYLLEKDFMDTVAAGPVKSDMYLLLGLAEKGKQDANPAKVEEYLRKVGAEARGYPQAQSALGDIYREKGLSEEAIRCYNNAVGSSDYAANALFYLASIYIDQAGKTNDAKTSKALYQKSGDLLGQLYAKYPLSPLTKQAREKADILATKGIDVTFATSGDEMLKGWEKTASEKKGSMEGAQALLSIMRYHFKKVAEEKTGKLIKAPDYAACAAACDRLLDEKVYTGAGLGDGAWKSIKGEALYQRAQCELASIGAPANPPAGGPKHIAGATAEKAAGFFTAARPLVDPKQLELVKGINIGLVEALFKSDKKESKEEAQKRFTQLENDYSNDPRFQKLAIDLAEWYFQQGQLVESARQYQFVATRSKDLSVEDTMKLFHSAGSLYSRAAWEAREKNPRTGYGIYIYPKETIQLGDDLLKTYPPLQKSVEMHWPTAPAQGLTARNALLALSKAAGVPFVWSTGGGRSINKYLDDKRVSVKDGRYTVSELLGQILDPKTHKLAFDIGVADGAPTIPPVAVKDDDPESERGSKVIEIYDARDGEARYKPLARPYGAWKNVHAGRASTMLYNIVQRVEETTQTRIVWADVIDKQDREKALGAEFKQLPGIAPATETNCAEALAAALDQLNLRFRVVQRDVATEMYEAAKDCFNEVRKIDPKSKYGERSLFAVALNYYNEHDYERMKAVLREYLKLFDNPSNEYYYDACFWVGWAFENERKYRDAINYYSRAAEERLVVAKAEAGALALGREELKKLMSYDTQFALAEPVSGEFKEMTLAKFADFVRVNTHVDVRLDPSAQAIATTLDRPAFKGVTGVDLLVDEGRKLGLTYRVENVKKEMAERAYFRLASSYRKENLMEQALENCNVLLARFPETTRRLDTYRMMLDIYKGLRDYRNVLATLEELKKAVTEPDEQRRLELEIANIHFDMADYAKASAGYKASLTAAKEPREIIAVRDSYARSLFREGNMAEALDQYDRLSREESDALRAYLYGLMSFYVKFHLGKVDERELPEATTRYILAYEKLSEEERGRLPAAELAKVTWIYYVLGLIDVKKGRAQEAIPKLNAASASPDDVLAGEAGYRLAQIYMAGRDYPKAKGALEYLLFATRSSESTVRATYTLGQCLQAMGQNEQAVLRYGMILQRYPLSPYVDEIKKNPLYRDVQEKLKPASTQARER